MENIYFRIVHEGQTRVYSIQMNGEKVKKYVHEDLKITIYCPWICSILTIVGHNKNNTFVARITETIKRVFSA